MCQEQAWDDVEQLLTTKGLFGFGKKKKSPVGFERVVKLLAGEKARDWLRTPDRKEYKAPERVSTLYDSVGLNFLNCRNDIVLWF